MFFDKANTDDGINQNYDRSLYAPAKTDIPRVLHVRIGENHLTTHSHQHVTLLQYPSVKTVKYLMSFTLTKIIINLVNTKKHIKLHDFAA